MSNASLNFRLLTVSVNSSTKPGGMDELVRRSSARSTTRATSETETAMSNGPKVQPSASIMNRMSGLSDPPPPPPAPPPPAAPPLSWAAATFANQAIATNANPNTNQN